MEIQNRRLSDLVIENPILTAYFREKHFDFCCNGHRTLAEVCKDRDINVEEIISEIDKYSEANKNSDSVKNFDDYSLEELTEHIVSRYHDDLKKRIPELIFLSEKVERVHRDKEFCPKGVASLLKDLFHEMREHMNKEEQILFPMIASGKGHLANMPIKVMMDEHKGHGKQLELFAPLTHDFHLPVEACNSWRTLYRGLQVLEAELMEHIHIENNILFPRALNGEN